MEITHIKVLVEVVIAVMVYVLSLVNAAQDGAGVENLGLIVTMSHPKRLNVT
jgi:hypothetical protein